jgi:hypothetical protein
MSAVVVILTNPSAAGVDARHIDTDVVCRIRPDKTSVCVDVVKFWTVPEGASVCLLQVHGYPRCAYQMGEVGR